MKHSIFYPFFFLLCFCSFSLSAQVVTWTGGQSNYWHDNKNWDTGIVPQKGEDVVIPTSSGVIYYYPKSEVESVSIFPGNQLIIDKNASLEVIGSNSYGLRIRAGAEVINSGQLFISEANSEGINLSGDMTNERTGVLTFKQVGLEAIKLNANATFINEGALEVVGSVGDGLLLFGTSLFRNTSSGEISIRKGYPGNIRISGQCVFENNGLIDFEANNRNPIYNGGGEFYNEINGEIAIQQSYTDGGGMFMGIGGVFENSGSIYLSKVVAGLRIGIDFRVGNFKNLSRGQIVTHGFATGIYLATGNSFENEGKIIIRNNDSYGLNNNGTVYNLGSLSIRNGNGIYNWSSGSIINTGSITQLGVNEISIRNNGNFSNELCSSISTEGRLANYGNFDNYGYLDCLEDGYNSVGNQDVNNYGIVLDPYDRILPILNNEAIRIRRLENLIGPYTFNNVLDIDDMGDYEMDEYWYEKAPFVYENEVGFFNEVSGEFFTWDAYASYPFPYAYAIFIHTPSGCVTAVKIPANPIIAPLTTDAPATQLSKRKTAAAELSVPIEISVYPNPTSDVATFEIKNHEAEEYQLEVFDLNGRLIHAANFLNEPVRILSKQLPSGLYVYKLRSADGFFSTGKLIRK